MKGELRSCVWLSRPNKTNPQFLPRAELDQILGEADSLSELFGDELKERIEFMNEKLQQKKPRKLLLGYRRLLKKVDKEYDRYKPTDDANSRPKIDQFKAQNVFSKADPVLEIAMNGGLKLCQGIFEKIEEMEDKVRNFEERSDELGMRQFTGVTM